MGLVEIESIYSSVAVSSYQIICQGLMGECINHGGIRCISKSWEQSCWSVSSSLSAVGNQATHRLVQVVQTSFQLLSHKDQVHEKYF